MRRAPCPALLDVWELEAGYGASRVLFGVSLRVEHGEVVALLGRNGAGKSTTLKAIMGIVPSTRGRVLLAGQDISPFPSHAIARRGIGYVAQDRRIFSDLTVRENLEVGRRVGVSGESCWTVDRICELFPALGPLRNRRGEYLSGGEQQMLAIARTLMGNPRLLLLDEPSEGLAPLVAQSLARQVLYLKHGNIRQLLRAFVSEQNIRFATLVTDRAYVLEKGRVRQEGEMRQLAADRSLMERHLSV